jgi:hypothetical protein
MGSSGAWGITLAVTAAAVLMGLAGTFPLKRVRAELGGVIGSRHDLEKVREAISLNMKLALVYLALWVGFLAFLGAGVFLDWWGFGDAVTKVFVFGVVTLPPGLWSRSEEKRFRAMRVECGDPSVAETFARWLSDWGKAGVSLKE